MKHLHVVDVDTHFAYKNVKLHLNLQQIVDKIDGNEDSECENDHATIEDVLHVFQNEAIDKVEHAADGDRR